MTFIQKNKYRIILILSVLILLSTCVVYWLEKRLFHSVADIDCKVYPKTLSVGDTLFYADKTSFSAIKKWEFGDGNISVNDNGYHLYKQPGFYQVTLTLNDQYSKTFSIEVLANTSKGNIADQITKIEAPIQAMQFENVIFRAKSSSAKLFSWKFGESGTIDSKEQMVIYAYKTPGDYVVTLYTDETAYPITHKIKVLPSFKVLGDSTAIEDVYKEIDEDFKSHLQQIANGSNFNTHYNYLLTKYLCKNENVATKVNTSKINTFYYYCMGLQFDKQSTIQSVKTGFDENLDCVTKVEITQSR